LKASRDSTLVCRVWKRSVVTEIYQQHFLSVEDAQHLLAESQHPLAASLDLHPHAPPLTPQLQAEPHAHEPVVGAAALQPQAPPLAVHEQLQVAAAAAAGLLVFRGQLAQPQLSPQPQVSVQLHFSVVVHLHDYARCKIRLVGAKRREEEELFAPLLLR
jgi:hypothetical protein